MENLDFFDVIDKEIKGQDDEAVVNSMAEDPKTGSQKILKFRDTPVWELPVGNRTKNALQKNGIMTVEGMLNAVQNLDEISAWRGVGKVVMDEIKDISSRIEIIDNPEKNDDQGSNDSLQMIVINRGLLNRMGKLDAYSSQLQFRAYSRLKNSGVENLLDFLYMTPEILMQKRNIGTATADEICRILCPKANRVYLTTKGTEIEENTDDVSQSNEVPLKLLVRYVKENNDVRTCVVSGEQLLNIFAADEDRVKPWLFEQLDVDGDEGASEDAEADIVLFEESETVSNCRQLGTILERALKKIGIQMLSPSSDYLVGRMLSVPGSKVRVDGKIQLTGVLQNVFVGNALVQHSMQKKLVRALEMTKVGLKKHEIVELYPEAFRDPEIIDTMLHKMVDDGSLYSIDDIYLIGYQSVRTWLENYPDERKRQILQLRLNGGTLEDVGQTVKLTRERVRQIVENCLSETRFMEDHLGWIYEKYYFDDEQVRLAFGILEGNYLSLKYKRGKKPLEEAIEDEGLPPSIRIKIERSLERDYIHDGNYLVKRQSNEVKNHIIRTQCKESTTVDEYIEKHTEFCRKYNLDSQRFSLDDQSIANKLHDSMITVTTYGKRFRYYPIELFDYTDLFEVLQLDSYNDVEYSAQYFFTNYPELMQQYNILDYCELHNLLKKLLQDGRYPNISFGRMPVIRFGNPDRDEQVKALLRDCAPSVENMTLAKLYEERYGVSTPTFIANYTQCIREYFFAGKYELSCKPLAEEEVVKMKERMTEDFYVTEAIRKIYREVNPEATGDEIVPLTIRQLDFHPYQGYAIRTGKYKSSTEYIESLLLGSDEVNIADFPPKLTIQHLFSRLYMIHKQNYEIFEVKPGHLINWSVLEGRGLTKEELDDYIDAAVNFHMEERFFSICSMRKAGFTHPLDRLEMSEWFYASLLQQRSELFSVQRVGGAKILQRGHNPFNAATVFEDVIKKKGPMTPEELCEYMKECHGATLDRNRLLIMASSVALFYDRLTKKLYYEDENLEKMLAEREKSIAGDKQVK